MRLDAGASVDAGIFRLARGTLHLVPVGQQTLDRVARVVDVDRGHRCRADHVTGQADLDVAFQLGVQDVQLGGLTQHGLVRRGDEHVSIGLDDHADDVGVIGVREPVTQYLADRPLTEAALPYLAGKRADDG